MTPEERVLALHARMDDRRRMRERQKTAVNGSAGAVLTICLAILVFGGGGMHLGGAAGPYSGAALLFKDAGGYVLAAVLAFMAGVALTVFLLRRREQAAQSEKESKIKLNEKAQS